MVYLAQQMTEAHDQLNPSNPLDLTDRFLTWARARPEDERERGPPLHAEGERPARRNYSRPHDRFAVGQARTQPSLEGDAMTRVFLADPHMMKEEP
ncbi:hypothetical protein [Micromonospora deserti]|uniref:hypothetical protein n=1 Tax=Micromonospora deserti TaxID=2070366 RepID=UPI001F3A87B4|nr:hypothetical protein [Micromonospora deserti]